MSSEVSPADARQLKLLHQGVVEDEGVLKHWVDALADWLERRLRSKGKKRVVLNGGLSVSGLQHVGRLRGEVILLDVLRKLLESKGFEVIQYLTLYTQDAWKGKDEQRRVFRDSEGASRYTGWPLIKVPDPYGCHPNWVEHFWSDFGPYITEFTSGRVEVVTTTELYSGKLKEFVYKVLELRERVIEVVNKYRGRKPYPKDWIPFEPRCSKCGRIDTTVALRVGRDGIVEYECKHCGHRGVTSIEDGKLNWRIEWVGIWWSLGVDFEPYGKDHAVPGGSRDSANELALKVFSFEPPDGIPYEWVAVRLADGKAVDMGSSDFLGFTPRDWLEVAHAEVLRFIYLKNPPMRKVVLDLHDVPVYYNTYYYAEKVYYGIEKPRSREEEVLLKRSYELSYIKGEPPESLPAQPPYGHVAILVQILPEELWLTEGLKRLKRSGHMPSRPTAFDLERLKSLMPRARNWVAKYAPPYMRIALLKTLSEELAKSIPSEIKQALACLARALEALESWDEDSIKKAMIDVGKDWSNEFRKEFYKWFYKVLLGRPEGPRAAPLVALLGKEWVINRLLEASSA